VAVHTEIDTLAKVGRAVLCPPPFGNERVLFHHDDDAHRVTRPAFTSILPVVEAGFQPGRKNIGKSER